MQKGGRRRTAPNFSLTSAKLSVGSTCRKIVCDLRLTRTYCEQVLEDIEVRPVNVTFTGLEVKRGSVEFSPRTTTISSFFVDRSGLNE